MNNPAAFVILCEDMESDKVFGGARIHALGGNQQLPIIPAVEEMDPDVHEKVNSFANEGTGEFFGLWNSMEVAGYGIGAIYLLRSSISIINQLNLKTMFALCSPFTARIASRYGFNVFKQLGKEGTFYYPKLDLLATVVFVDDTDQLNGADPEEKARIDSLREEPKESAKYLDLIEKSVKKLNIFTKNIISFHMNKRTGISVSKIELKSLLDSTIDDFKYFEKARDVRFESEVEQKDDYFSDRSRLIMILNNLISNSIKYQDRSKEPFVKVKLYSDSEMLRIEVLDNGIGISDQRKDKIFDMYYRGTEQRSGIGIHIVMEVIRMLNGKIEVDSREGEGTRFVIELPNMA